nr:MAG TPA: hypothetical protein [Caudoviricetes sp.]
MNKDTTLAWLQELSARGLIQPTGPKRFSTYPRPGQEPSTLTSTMPRKLIAQKLARSAKGNIARMATKRFCQRAAHKARQLGRVPSSSPALTEAYLAEPGYVIPIAPGDRWAYNEAVRMRHVEEVALDGLVIQLGWTTAVAASITDCNHDEGLDTFGLLKDMSARVEQSTQPTVVSSREEAIEVLEDVTRYVKEAYSRWGD